jgi:DNA-binding transcriptional regulator PaaX
MSRNYYPTTLKILNQVANSPGIKAVKLYELTATPGQAYKDFYNTLYRLTEQGYVERKTQSGDMCMWVTEEGQKLLKRSQPKRDGVWKLVVFDIPEKHKYVRTVLRAKLKALYFKKWQNSIWVSPYALDEEIEQELQELAKKFFVRLIKTTDINFTGDLEKLFEH